MPPRPRPLEAAASIPTPMPNPTRVLPVAFTGSHGAYSEEAARRHFGGSPPTLTCDSPRDALRAVADGRAGHAVIAVENSITGPFDRVADALFEAEVHVVGEVHLTIRHCLLAAPGAKLDEIAVVTSHTSALARCRDWLASWGVATRPAHDTAAAAAELAASRDAASAVLGSRTLAALYGLDVLAEGLSDRPDNSNRFLVFAAQPTADADARRSAALLGPLAAPRALKTLRIQLEARGASRARVPFLGSSDGTRFLVEFDHRPGEGPKLARETLESLPHRFLGSWLPPM